MPKLFSLKGKIQNYAWGGTQYIPNLLNKQASNEKCAEYWLGAHINAPSTIQTLKGEEQLNRYISSNPTEILGSKVYNKFKALPFLFKVLDVFEMLSIQVHPTKIEAEKGFKHENELGIPLSAAHRNYKDDNHKPEIMVALSEFWLLHGFLPKAALKKRISSIPEFSSFISVFNEDDYYSLYKYVMEQSVEETNTLLQPLVDRIVPLFLKGELEKSSPDYWAAKSVVALGETSNFDKGIYSIYFFNIVKAEKGEAVFQDAGIPHAYLEGQNMELMANSDNVLRGGLTPKHIDVPELLKHVAFEETIPNIMTGELQKDGLERIYKSPAPDFELSRIDISSDNEYTSESDTAQILILVAGKAEVLEGDTALKLGKGDTVFLTANSTYRIKSDESAILYKATAGM